MYSNCEDNYRPVIICFVQCQHSSVQFVPKKMDRYTKLRATSRTMNIHQQSILLGHHKYKGSLIRKENNTNGVNRLNSVQKATNLESVTKQVNTQKLNYILQELDPTHFTVSFVPTWWIFTPPCEFLPPGEFHPNPKNIRNTTIIAITNIFIGRKILPPEFVPPPKKKISPSKNVLNVGSHDPFFESDYLSCIVSAHRNVDSRH